MAAPTYFPQQQLDGDWSVYEADGTIALSIHGIPLRDIDTLGGAQDHIRDLIAADEAKAQRDAFEAACDELESAIEALIAKQQAENAALDDFEAQAHAMAYGPAVTGRAA